MKGGVKVKSTVNQRMTTVERIINRVSELATTVSVITLVALVLLVTTDVVMRYFFARPIPGSDEITTYMMISVGFLGLGLTALNDQHIKVELIVEHFPRLGQKVIVIINYCIVVGVSGLLGFEAFEEAMLVKKMHLASSITNIPSWPFYLIVTLGFFLLMVAALMLLVQTVSKGGKE